MLTYGSLFSGIGGIDLGLDWAGMTPEWQVELDCDAGRVLGMHWPRVARWRDIKTFPPAIGERCEWYADVICGGFPCQDISLCNYRGKGLDGERSGLWSEYFRIICELRPRYVLIENVAALLVRGLGRILGSLSAIGFDAEWRVISAAAFGAPHRRSRLFIVAYPSSERCKTHEVFKGGPHEAYGETTEARSRFWPGRTESLRPRFNRVRWVPDSELCRVAHGFPDELHRYKQLGNAVVPYVAEWIGRRIIEHAAKY